MRGLKKALLTLAGIVAALAVIAAGTAWLKPEVYVWLAYPDFPDLRSPKPRLAATDEGRIHFRSRSPYNLSVLLSDSGNGRRTIGVGTLHLPADAAGGAPVPAMVILPGSGGIAPDRETDYAEMLAEHGIAGFVVDYYMPRGVGGDDVPYMMKTTAVTDFDVVSDAYHALRRLRSHPAIDPGRIGVMGMSYGGMAARFAMDARIKRALIGDRPGFRLHIDVYGPCYQDLQSPAVTGAPLLTLRGTEDASNDLEACREREQDLRELGATVEAEVYEGAGHSWERGIPRREYDYSYVRGCTVRYDEHGDARVGERTMTDLPLDASRATRIVNRFSSGFVLGDCVKSGYIMGDDPETERKADRRILRFLDEHL